MATIKEDYVSFEIAKLLKEKGFDIPVKYYYWKDTIIHSNCYNWNEETEKYSRPTIQMVMKWLREVHHLVIQIELIDFLEHGEVWLYSIIERKTIKRLTDKDGDFTEHSYEEACEAAIKYCLENLI